MTNNPYKFWTVVDLNDHLLHQAEQYKCPEWVFQIVAESFQGEWDPVKEFDGCSIVQDTTHPDLACYIHDFMWRTGRGGYTADSIFLEVMKMQGLKKGRYIRRWVSVRAGWAFYHSWKHLIKRNVNPLTAGMINYKNNG